MANEFDPYREALVIEAITLWPEEYDDLSATDRRAVEMKLHAEPAKAAELEYVRTHTGFQRQISVTPQDLARIK